MFALAGGLTIIHRLEGSKDEIGNPLVQLRTPYTALSLGYCHPPISRTSEASILAMARLAAIY